MEQSATYSHMAPDVSTRQPIPRAIRTNELSIKRMAFVIFVPRGVVRQHCEDLRDCRKEQGRLRGTRVDQLLQNARKSFSGVDNNPDHRFTMSFIAFAWRVRPSCGDDFPTRPRTTPGPPIFE